MSTTKVTDALRNVTVVDAAKITTGTIPEARIATLAASKLTGTVADARFPATLPAASGVNLTALNGSNIGSGTVPTARLGTGTASSSTFLRGDSTYAEAGGGKVLQIYTLINTTGYSTSSVFGNGTTLPTISDGTSLFDAAAFTPTSGSSKILVEAYIATSGTDGGHATVWMCKDSISNAVAVSSCHSQTSYIQLLKLTYEESASNTNARTFKLRYSNNYGGRTTTINKNHEGNNTWGGINSTIQITEYAT